MSWKYKPRLQTKWKHINKTWTHNSITPNEYSQASPSNLSPANRYCKRFWPDPNGMNPKWHGAYVAQIPSSRNRVCKSQYACWLNLPSFGVCLLPRNLFLLPAKLSGSWCLERECREIPGELLSEAARKSHSPVPRSTCHRQLGPQPRPSGTYQVPCCLGRVTKNYNENAMKAKLVRQVLLKKERLIQVPQPGRIVDSHLK